MAYAYMLGMIERERRMRRSQARRSQLRLESVPWDMQESEIVANYRLSLGLFQNLVDELRPFMASRQRSTGISIELKIMAALDFYAGGSYQRRVGKDFNLGLCQSAIHKCIADVTDALNQTAVLQRHIVFPNTSQERMDVMRGFMDVFGFPGVVGCIDCTHIAIIRPHMNEEAFFNRKHYHSLNTMIICDVNLNILYVDASYGGASHDSHVWNRCPIEAHMTRLNEAGQACWLLGDSGYSQRDWLMQKRLLLNTSNTFMSTDSFHHRVELAMKRMKNKIYDFDDFCEAVNSARKNVNIKKMTIDEFYEWQDYTTQYKLSRLSPRPYISDMEVNRGSFDIRYRTYFDNEPITASIIGTKFLKLDKLPSPTKKTVPAGISQTKQKYFKISFSLIPANRMSFWRGLPTFH